MKDEKPTPKHIEAAIQRCSELNNHKGAFGRNRWAILEVVPTKYRAIARVTWGHIRYDGRREKEIQTLNFDMDKNGNVVISEHTHS